MERERDDSAEVHYSMIKPTKTDLGLRNFDLQETWMYTREMVTRISCPCEGGKNFQRRDLTLGEKQLGTPEG